MTNITNLNRLVRDEVEWLSSPAQYDDVGLRIGCHSVVEHWEQPAQEALAGTVCRPNAQKILEIGYGLGLSAKFVNSLKPNTHVIVEAHPQVVIKAIEEMPSSTLIFSALWEKIVPLLNGEFFDGIIYDAYPMMSDAFDGSSLSTFRYVEPFLYEGSRLLRNRGRLGFLDYSCGVTELGDFASVVTGLFSESSVKELPIEVREGCAFASGNRCHIVILEK